MIGFAAGRPTPSRIVFGRTAQYVRSALVAFGVGGVDFRGERRRAHRPQACCPLTQSNLDETIRPLVARLRQTGSEARK